MERQGGFDVVQVNEAVNFAIGITGDVGDVPWRVGISFNR